MAVLKIGGHKVKLVVEPLKHDTGEFDYANNTITIDRNVSPSMQQSTLLHEAMHGMNTTVNHEFLDSLAEQLFQFLVDNDLWNEKRALELLK